MTDRKKHGMMFWATGAVGAVLAYVASFWPANWLMGFMLRAGWINEGGQVIFGLLYYPIWRLLGYQARLGHDRSNGHRRWPLRRLSWEELTGSSRLGDIAVTITE